MYGLQMMQEKDMYVVVHQYCLQHNVHNKCCKYIEGTDDSKLLELQDRVAKEIHPAQHTNSKSIHPKQEHQIKAQWMDVMNGNRHVGRQKPDWLQLRPKHRDEKRSRKSESNHRRMYGTWKKLCWKTSLLNVGTISLDCVQQNTNKTDKY